MRAFLLVSVTVLAVSPTWAQSVPLTTSSDEARAHFEEGRLHAVHAEAEKAQGSFDAALAADPDFALALAYRASITPDAERQPFLDRAIAHKGDASEGERLMVASYEALSSGDPDGELRLLGEVAARYPDDPFPSYTRAWRLYRLGRFDEAKAAAEATLAADPDFAAAHNLLGYIALDQGDHTGAEDAFKEYIRLAPERPNPYDSLGELYLKTGRYDEAAAQFEQALARDPDFTVSSANLIRARIEQGNARFEDAFARQDATALAALYTPDAMLFPPDSEPVTDGRDAIQAFWTGAFGSGLDGIDLGTLDVRSAGDVAYEQGIATIRAGGEVAVVAAYTVLWKQTADGWKLHHDTWTPTGSGAAMKHESEVEWTEVAPGVAFGAVYGDWQAEPYGKLVRFDSGSAVPLHTHTHAYRGVMVTGRLMNPYVGEDDPPVLGPGDAWYVPGGVPHSNTCVSEEPCLFYTYGDTAWDVQIVE